MKIKKLLNKVTSSTDTIIKFKYPKALTIEGVPLMKRSGTYSKQKPEGVIIHFTAGHSEQKGRDAIIFANSMGHRYFFVDQAGQVFQQFCLTGYGAHAGESVCPKTKRSSVARYYVGIEVACEGRLSKENITSWGKRIPAERIRAGFINDEFQKAEGVFETFEEAQEKALIELCVWLCRNCGFDESTIWGHDEVAPKRKNDPGLSMSMSMKEFRNIIKSKLG